MRAKEEIALLHAKMADGSLPEDEPLFVLRAKDCHAAEIVRAWVARCNYFNHRVPQEKLDEALSLAERMDAWPIKQIPGRPETKTDARQEQSR